METTGPSKILWHSVAPWATTGYGIQTALFATRMAKAGHDVAISAFYGLGGAALEWEGMQVYPGDDRHGNVSVPQLAKRHKADAVITLMDVWVLDPAVFSELNVGCWVPVDHEPCPPVVANFFRESGARPIAMSRFGERMLQAEGLDPLYVPHGINTNVFKPAGGDRAALRKAFNLPPDAFVVGMVANNSGHTPPRKAFPQAIMAFSAFRREHPDAVLWLHTELTGVRSGANPGVNIIDLCERFEVPPEAVMFASQTELDVGIPDTVMAALYSSMDVLLNPSYGEGFGIPIVEAQACGTPVIVSDWTSMPELCGAGWRVGGEPWWDPQHRAFFLCPFVGDIIQALEQAYAARGDQAARAAARTFALQYDADLVMETCWVPALAELCRPREVPPLPNREQRRAAAKRPVAKKTPAKRAA